MQKTSITHLDNEHNDWLRSLEFYKHECILLKDRLTEVAGKNTDREVAQDTERYENQLKIQITNIDTLRHDINENLSLISKDAQSSAAHVDIALIQQHDALRERFVSEEKIISTLRYEFNRFAAKWM